MAKRLTITVTATGFLAETEFQNTLGYWNVMSRTVTQNFPLLIVGRVADRADYTIRVKVVR